MCNDISRDNVKSGGDCILLFLAFVFFIYSHVDFQVPITRLPLISATTKVALPGDYERGREDGDFRLREHSPTENGHVWRP